MTPTQIATIDAHMNCVTLVNIDEVEPEKQVALANLLSNITEASIRYQPGVISVSIHSSFDGKRVVNYAQWASKADFEAFMKKPETQEQLKQFAMLAASVSLGLYRVETVHGAS